MGVGRFEEIVMSLVVIIYLLNVWFKGFLGSEVVDLFLKLILECVV